MWVSVFKPFRYPTWADHLIARLNIAIPKDGLTGSTQHPERVFGRNQTVSTDHVTGSLSFQLYHRS